MSLLVRAAVLVAAGAAGWMLARRKGKQAQNSDDPHVYYLKDEDAVIDAPAEEQRTNAVTAEARSCYRRMDPLTLIAQNEAIFRLEDGSEVKLNFGGEGGLHLKEGDRGLLSWQGMRLIRFEKDNGDVIGGMFYAPAGRDADEE